MRRPSWLVAALALGLTITSCSTPAAVDPPNADEPAVEQESPEPTETPAPDAPAEEGFPGSVNALELIGPADAQEVPDMEPVVTGLSPILPARVTDSVGTEITITSAERVLSLDLYGTLTDTLIGLGLHERLVGRANSDSQDVLADLPVVTQSGHDLNVEAVLSLHPDLIITNTTIGTPQLYDQLEAAGVTVVRFEEIPNISSISEEILAVGAVFGLEAESQALADHTEEKLVEARATIDQMRSLTPRNPRGLVLYVRGTAGVFFILGAGYGAADVIDFLGLEDVAKENGIADLRPANAESLVSLDPEVILAMRGGVLSGGGIDGLLERPGVSTTTAGQNQRIITAGDTQLLAYGPRTPDNLIALGEAIYLDPAASTEGR